MSNAAAEMTITHEVLLSFGHTMRRDAAGCTVWTANPARCDRWGGIPEADWQAADDAENAPVYGPRTRRAVTTAGRYVSTHEHYMATGEDLPCGYHEQTFVRWE
jgi:hypothetical protein